MSRRVLLRVLFKSWKRRSAQWVRYASFLSGNSSDAEDLVQEALVRTLRARPDIREEAVANAYVRRAIRSRVVDLYQIRRRTRAVSVEDAENQLPAASSALQLILDEELRHQEQESTRRLLALLKTLNPEQRQALKLRVLREPPMTLREVADIQGVSIAAVQYRERAAIATLRKKLLGDEEESDD